VSVFFDYSRDGGILHIPGCWHANPYLFPPVFVFHQPKLSCSLIGVTVFDVPLCPTEIGLPFFWNLVPRALAANDACLGIWSPLIPRPTLGDRPVFVIPLATGQFRTPPLFVPAEDADPLSCANLQVAGEVRLVSFMRYDRPVPIIRDTTIFLLVSVFLMLPMS